MVRAAAKEPAIVALAKTFLEFMGVILSREDQTRWSNGVYMAFTTGLPENPAASGFKDPGSRCYERPDVRLPAHLVTMP
jgi:hypothetical protein